MGQPAAPAGSGDDVTVDARCRRCGSTDLSRPSLDAFAECRVCHLVFDPSRVSPALERGHGTTGSRREELSLVAPEGVTAVEVREGGDSRGEGGRVVGVRVTQPGAPLDPRFVFGWGAVSMLVMLPVFLPVLRLTEPLGEAWSQAIGIGSLFLPLGYFALASQLNQLSIVVEQGVLRTGLRPLPVFGGRSIAAGDLEQLFVERVRDTYRRDEREIDFEEYRLIALVRGKRAPVLLARGMKTAAHALFLESTLERVLGIEDRIVPGELHEKIVAMARQRGRA